MIEQGDGIAAAVAGSIPELLADFGATLAVPKKLHRSELPRNTGARRRGSRVVRESGRHMAGRTGYRLGANPACPPMNVHPVNTRLRFTGRGPDRNTACVHMAVCAAWMGNNRLDSFPCFHTCHTADATRGQGIPGTFTFGVDHRRERGHYRSSECSGNQSSVHDRLSQTKSMNLLNGISRMRLPVAAKMALASAGAAGGTGGSPIPRTV